MAIVFVINAFPVFAQQTLFKKDSRGLKTEFSYAWRHKDAQYNLSFALETTALFAMPPSPSNYSPKVFQDNLYVKVMQAAQQIDPKMANIDVTKNHSGLSFNVSSNKPNQAQKVLDKLKLVHDKAEDEYWADNYFVKYHSPTGASGIRHDHAKYTLNSSDALLPIVRAIKQLQTNQQDIKEFITIALGWIQSIPYNSLEDRLTSNGAGFISPRDLLLQNQGDCDSKSTLMAALLKAYNRELNVHMVYLPDHALLAVDLHSLGVKANQAEITLQYRGKSFVLIEPTGPAQFSIGELADSTTLSLHNRQFDLASMTQ
jgi:hypothetical protein